MTLKKDAQLFMCFRKLDFLKHRQCHYTELSASLKDQHGGKQCVTQISNEYFPSAEGTPPQTC